MKESGGGEESSEGRERFESRGFYLNILFWIDSPLFLYLSRLLGGGGAEGTERRRGEGNELDIQDPKPLDQMRAPCSSHLFLYLIR